MALDPSGVIRGQALGARKYGSPDVSVGQRPGTHQNVSTLLKEVADLDGDPQVRRRQGTLDGVAWSSSPQPNGDAQSNQAEIAGPSPVEAFGQEEARGFEDEPQNPQHGQTRRRQLTSSRSPEEVRSQTTGANHARAPAAGRPGACRSMGLSCSPGRGGTARPNRPART